MERMDLITQRANIWIIVLALSLGSTAFGTVWSQQFLNLDFEKRSAEGLARPWGWQVNSYAPGVSFVCDTLVNKHGQQSLLITGSDEVADYPFELTFAVEPNQLLNQKVSIRAWAKTAKFSGQIGIKLQTIGEVGDGYGILQEQDIPIQNSSVWQAYQATDFDLGDALHTFQINLYFQGKGQVWFDNIELLLDGKAQQSVPVAPAFNEEQLDWLEAQSTSITSVVPATVTQLSQVDFSDLAYFKELVGKARIIALGEATHGTSEFFALKHRLLQYAIRDLGVRTFILEDNQLLVERINQFVLHGTGTASQVIRGLFAVWNTEEMLEMIKWIRAYNLAHPNDPVAFMGMDVQNPQLALEELQKFLLQADPPLAHLSDSLLADFAANWRNSYFKEEPELQEWVNQATRIHEAVEARAPEWRKDNKPGIDDKTVLWAVQNARLILQSTQSILSGGFEGRDEAMAENVDWIMKHFSSGERVVVWAHDSHISRGEATQKADNYFLGYSMGSHLAKRHGEDYCAFGLFTYSGTCRGTISYSNFDQITFQLYTSPIGSLDEGLHQVANALTADNLLLGWPTTNQGQALPNWLLQARPVRYVGYVAEDYGFGGRHVLPKQFDGIFFIDQSSASQRVSKE